MKTLYNPVSAIATAGVMAFIIGCQSASAATACLSLSETPTLNFDATSLYVINANTYNILFGGSYVCPCINGKPSTVLSIECMQAYNGIQKIKSGINYVGAIGTTFGNWSCYFGDTPSTQVTVDIECQANGEIYEATYPYNAAQ